MRALIEVVIGDVHARPDLLRAVLTAVHALDSRGRRRPGFWAVQVGDLLDRRADPAANLHTARLAANTLDVVLVGNHEAEMLDAPSTPHGRALATLTARGWPQAAAEVGGWLVTHAGVHPGLTHSLPAAPRDCAREINDRWHRRAPGGGRWPLLSSQRLGDPLFDWVGPARGGVSPYGGLFWGAASEWPPNARTPWGQICGHVPQRRPRLLTGPRWLIDVGSEPPQLAALVRREGARGWSPVVVRLSRRGAVLANRSTKRQHGPSD